MGSYNGVPLHPLVVHAVVVFVPLAVLAAIVFAVVPRWRWLFRWPLVVLALIGAASTFVAAQSGEALLETFRQAAAAQRHASLALTFRWYSLGFSLVSLVSAFVLGGPSGLASGRGARAGVGGRALQGVVAIVLVVAALVTLVQVVRTGDAGGRAVWFGTKVGTTG